MGKVEKKNISFFFPAFNDEGTVQKLVEDAISVLESVSNDYEIIIVDDGSVDNTGEVADEMAKERGLIGDDTWSRLIPGIGFSKAEPVFVPEGRDPKELKAKQRRAARIFYLRPQPIWNLAHNIRSFNDFKRYFYAARLLLKL